MNPVDLDLVGIARAIREGDVSAERVVRWSIERLERNGRALNAVMDLDAEAALDAARVADAARRAGAVLGPLHGVPLAHKDLFDRSGRPCSAGSIIGRSPSGTGTASVLTRLDAAGAIDVARLHLSEFALSPVGYNRHFGHGRNPWAADRVSGGSSSGSAIAVAGRMVFGSIGSDTGGSIRLPASMCGVTGLKPTWRRVPADGVMPLARSLDCVGPLAQSARDCARLLQVIAAEGASDPIGDPRAADAAPLAVPGYEALLDGRISGLRIAVPRRYYYDDIAADVRRVLDDSLRAFAECGAVVVETQPPDPGDVDAAMRTVMMAEAASVHRSWLEERRGDYGEQVLRRIEPGLDIPATRYIEALELRSRLRAAYLEHAMAGCDLVHLPVVQAAVPTIEATSGAGADAATTIERITRCTRGINYLGLPAMSVPGGFCAGGLPVGFQLVGRPFDEATLLRAADAFQRVTDWHRRVPPVARGAGRLCAGAARRCRRVE